MTYASQFYYDHATEPDIIDYQNEPAFAELAEYVTLELLAGRDWQNLSSEILMIDLELESGGYQMALEWVSNRLTEEHINEIRKV